MHSEIKSRLSSFGLHYAVSANKRADSEMRFFWQAAAEAFGCTLERLIPAPETYETKLTASLSTESNGRNKEELDEGGWEKLIGRFALQPTGLQK